MKTFSELLENKYQSFINKEDDWIFFAELAAYVELFIRHPDLEPTVLQLFEERDKLFNENEEANRNAEEALLLRRDKVKSIINENKIEDEQLKAIDNEIDMLLDGRISSSQSNAEFISQHLHDYCLRGQALGHIEVLSEFCYVQENGYARTHFDELLEETRRLKRLIERKQEDTMWGALSQLIFIREMVFYAQDRYEELHKKGFSVKVLDYGAALGAMKDIREGKKKSYNAFNRNVYEIYVRRLHYYLISELLLRQSEGRLENLQSDLELDYDIEENFEIWVKSEPDRRWQMKRNKEFSKGGEALFQMLKSVGEYVLPNSQNEQTVRNLKLSLVKGLNLRADDVKGLFIRKNNFWGIEKSYLSR